MSELYFGGPILTMEGPRPVYAEALLVEDGRICKVGSFAEAKAAARESPVLRDLRGRALLPAFIDSHSHITQLARTVRLVSLEGCTSIDELCARLAERARDGKAGEWINGYAYDHNALPGKRHPTRFDLDRVSMDRPVLVTHASGHFGVANSKALSLLGITADTPDPSGGRIGRIPGAAEPDGFLEENAFFSIQSKLPAPLESDSLDWLDEAQETYLSYGIATAQDGMTNALELTLLKEAARQGRLKLDVAAYIELKSSARLLRENRAYVGAYRNRLKIGGYKMFLDGSPQGRTAWVTEPYLGGPAGYRGYPALETAEVEANVRMAAEEGVQLLAHCNGDAAAQQYIDAWAKCGRPGLRPVIIHAQLLRRDQLDAVKANGMIPSYFVAHTWYWGDAHLQNFGWERGSAISPVKSTLEKGIPFTLHQDTPVIRPDMLETVWCAVNRVTREGVRLAESERATPYEALLGVTRNAAYQYGEEAEKGTLREGKRADLVILDRDPAACAPEKLREIQVLETVKDGKTVYEKA